MNPDRVKTLLWLGAWSLASVSCNGDPLSIGELRCEGAATSCVPAKLSPLQGDTYFPATAKPVGTASWVWTRPWSFQCGLNCMLGRWSVVVHADGTFVAATELVSMTPGAGGVSLAAHAADGSESWRDGSISTNSRGSGSSAGAPVALALAVDPRGGDLFAVSDGQINNARLRVYQIPVSRKLKLLFETDHATDARALSVIGNDILVAGRSGEGDGISEVSRYTRSGQVVWRQTSLASEQGPWPENQSPTSAIMKLLVEDDTALLVTRTPVGFAMVQFDAQGNVAWQSATGSGALDSQTKAELQANYAIGASTPNAILAVDHHGRPLLGQDGYVLDRFPAGAFDPSKATVKGVGHLREDYYVPLLFGLDVDVTDRTYVVTQTGAARELHWIVDRYSADLQQRDTFDVPMDIGPSHEPIDSTLQGIAAFHVLDNNDALVIGPGGVARLHLP